MERRVARTPAKSIAFQSLMSLVQLLEQGVKSVDALGPERLVVGEPIDQGPKPLRIDPVIHQPTVATLRHQSCLAQGPEMLGHRRLRDREPGRELLYCR